MESRLMLAVVLVLLLTYFWREVLGLLLVAVLTIAVFGVITLAVAADRLAG